MESTAEMKAKRGEDRLENNPLVDLSLQEQGVSMQDVRCVGDCTHCPVEDACDF